MTAVKFVAAWVRAKFLIPHHVTFKPQNLYYEICRELTEPDIKRKERRHAKAA
jgi:hypothetical protein